MEKEPEIWKSVVGWEDYYSVSTWGRVKTLQTRIKPAGYILAQSPVKNKTALTAYMHVCLCREGKTISVAVHRLMGRAFIGPCGRGTGLEVNHIDGDGTNNYIKNLEIVTRLQNLLHAQHILGRKRGASGEEHWAAKFKVQDIQEIRQRFAAGESNKTIAADYGKSPMYIYLITSNRIWKCVKQHRPPYQHGGDV